jgi:hypothetical protein
VVPPARLPWWTPGSAATLCSPPGPYVHRPISVGSPAHALKSTVSTSTSRMSRTRRSAGVTGAALPSASSSGLATSSRRAPPASVAQTIRPSLVRAGTPGTMSSQRSSVSSRSTAVATLAGSAESRSIRRWSRLSTTISGASPSQFTVTRYGNRARSQSSWARLPSRPASTSVTSALGVPAAG